MKSIECCKAKLEALNQANEKTAARCEKMVTFITNEILDINSEIDVSSKSVASILKEYRKKLEKARKIFANDGVKA